MVRRSMTTRPVMLLRPGVMGLLSRKARRSADMLCVATTRKTSPSKRKIAPRSAAHSRTAFSASVSNTGWRSKVDRPITLSSSLVAVCCSSATRSSLLRASSSVNRRTFSMAMTAWSAKVFEEPDLLLGERTDFHAPDQDPADGQRPLAATASPASCGVRRCRGGLPSGYSESDSAARSWMWIVCRSTIGAANHRSRRLIAR